MPDLTTPVWRRLPRPSRQGEARRNQYALAHLIITALCFSTFLSTPGQAATWTIRTQPSRLLNGAPFLIQISPPSKLATLTGTWLGHQLSFSYNPSTKTWFALAGVSFETTP